MPLFHSGAKRSHLLTKLKRLERDIDRCRRESGKYFVWGATPARQVADIEPRRKLSCRPDNKEKSQEVDELCRTLLEELQTPAIAPPNTQPMPEAGSLSTESYRESTTQTTITEEALSETMLRERAQTTQEITDIFDAEQRSMFELFYKEKKDSFSHFESLCEELHLRQNEALEKEKEKMEASFQMAIRALQEESNAQLEEEIESLRQDWNVKTQKHLQKIAAQLEQEHKHCLKRADNRIREESISIIDQERSRIQQQHARELQLLTETVVQQREVELSRLRKELRAASEIEKERVLSDLRVGLDGGVKESLEELKGQLDLELEQKKKEIRESLLASRKGELDSLREKFRLQESAKLQKFELEVSGQHDKTAKELERSLAEKTRKKLSDLTASFQKRKKDELLRLSEEAARSEEKQLAKMRTLLEEDFRTSLQSWKLEREQYFKDKMAEEKGRLSGDLNETEAEEKEKFESERRSALRLLHRSFQQDGGKGVDKSLVAAKSVQLVSKWKGKNASQLSKILESLAKKFVTLQLRAAGSSSSVVGSVGECKSCKQLFHANRELMRRIEELQSQGGTSVKFEMEG